MEALPVRAVPAAVTCGARGHHHHRPHVAQDVRPHHVDLEAGQLPDQGAGDRHVRVQVQLQLRRFRRGRRDPARHRRGPHRALPRAHGPNGEELMTGLTTDDLAAPLGRAGADRRPRARKRYSVARTLRYLAMLFFLLVVLIPVYVLVVTSFKGIGDASPALSLIHISEPTRLGMISY